MKYKFTVTLEYPPLTNVDPNHLVTLICRAIDRSELDAIGRRVVPVHRTPIQRARMEP